MEKAKISDRNKELILAFLNDLVLEGLSKARLSKYISTMKIIAEKMKKDLDKATIDDVKKFVGFIQQQDYSYWTKSSYKIVIRRFYKWHYKTKHYPEIVDWIKTKVSKSQMKLPSEGDLLVEKDIQKLLGVAEHPRDKALIAVLWESGARVGEVGNLQLKHIQFDKHGAIISVRGKTGSRKIRLISSVSHLSTWINNHPIKKNKNSFLWINYGNIQHNKTISYANIVKILKTHFKKAGIQKKSNPHLFRHSRATCMANHLTEFQMNQYFGWIQGSEMPSIYVHMSGKEVNNAILAMNGIETETEKEKSKMQPIICPRCDTINNYDSVHCNKCGGIVDLKHAMVIEQNMKERSDVDRMMNLLLKDSDVQRLLAEKMKSFA